MTDKGKVMLRATGSLWQEFRDFAFKGNMIDLAVAVVIGAAFADVIKALVDGLIMPMVEFVTPKDVPWQTWSVQFFHKGPNFHFGPVLAALLHFTIIALAVFLTVVKTTQFVMKTATRKAAPGEPTSRECPECLSVIPIKARRCAQCTTQLVPDGGEPGLVPAV